MYYGKLEPTRRFTLLYLTLLAWIPIGIPIGLAGLLLNNNFLMSLAVFGPLVHGLVFFLNLYYERKKEIRKNYE
ncbi:hypothetical protein AZF06_21620 [Priestia endophytica]|uniref:Proteolipid membrane potential modulator n=1 Tax=Priestia endophytica DSM 13796 TaxID=1121089 RepID=A0A1I6C0J4_9BACI|nr:hypothetical protein AZF06_21620 [Priestia endophytica]SFQ86605.1 hypothetical protein SAMN02745910_04679 [Priestia endophytica DSM 13796]